MTAKSDTIGAQEIISRWHHGRPSLEGLRHYRRGFRVPAQCGIRHISFS